MKIHALLRVTGNVQGVFYRASARDKAIELHISGYAKNEMDGSVFIEAEGEREDINSFISWCRQGPPQARVSEVHVTFGDIKNFTDFSIKRT